MNAKYFILGLVGVFGLLLFLLWNVNAGGGESPDRDGREKISKKRADAAPTTGQLKEFDVKTSHGGPVRKDGGAQATGTVRENHTRDHRGGDHTSVENPPMLPLENRRGYFSQDSLKKARAEIAPVVEACIDGNAYSTGDPKTGLSFVQTSLVVEVKEGLLQVKQAKAKLENASSKGLASCVNEKLDGFQVAGIKEKDIDTYALVFPFLLKD